MSVVLIYEVVDYSEMGGGISYAICDNQKEIGKDESQLIKIVNDLVKQHGDKFKVHFIGKVSHTIAIEPVTKVTEYRIKE